MNHARLFLDTVFIQALLNQRDQYHNQARRWLPTVKAADEVWTTEAVLVEVGNALSTFNRHAAAHFIRSCYQTQNMTVVNVDPHLMNQAILFYLSHQDKTWGFTDCISFVVMQEQGVHEAITADRHFVQAGFRALLLES